MHTLDWIIVGSGLYGATVAHELQKRGLSVAVIEARNHVGGNCYTEEREGIHVHVYGPHIFHTSKKEIWDFINQFAPFNDYRHRGRARIGDKIYSFPINLLTMNQMWGVNSPEEAEYYLQGTRIPCDNPRTVEDWALATMGWELYEAFFHGYSTKQWGRPPSELPAFIAKRLPYRFTHDDSYFPDTDKYQGIPIGGYTQIFERMLQGCMVITGVDFLEHRTAFEKMAPNILYTGCVDELFGYGEGHLEYRSLRFEHEVVDRDFQGCAIVNYPELSVPYTRIAEHQHFEFGGKSRSIITREYPQDHTPGTTPYYPIRDDLNKRLHGKYMQRAVNLFPNYHFGGRLASYQYYDMDMTIAAALTLTQKLV